MCKGIEEVFRIIVKKRVGVPVNPYSHQVKMFKAFDDLASGEKDVVVLLAPCGSGKTEAVVAPYLAQYTTQKIYIPKLIYATPTYTLLYNMRKRILGYVETLKHLGCLSNKELSKLEPEVERGLDLDPSYLVPRVTISTYDVLVYAWMARRTVPNRPFTTRGAIISSLIVFDETHLVQDLNMYSQRVLPRFIATMANVGVPIIVMSATLSNQWIGDLKSVIGSDRVEIVTPVNDNINIGFLDVQIAETKDDYGIVLDEAFKQIENYVLEVVESGKDVLIVLNTVEIAKAVYDRVKQLLTNRYGGKLGVIDGDNNAVDLVQQGKNVLLCFVHGRLPLNVRRVREEVFEVLKLLRSNMEKAWSLVVIATQVAEVGLDYSFDMVITEVAPPTAMIQRFMRGGRIKNQKARGVVLPPVTIEREGKKYTLSNYVYSKDLIDYSIEWVRKEKLSTSKLTDISFLKEVADDEYNYIAQHEKDWVKEMIDRARNIIEASRYFPPLATSIHVKTVEKFRLRLGEYTVLHVVQLKLTPDTSYGLKHNLTEYLKNLNLADIIGRAIRYNITIHKDSKKRGYLARIPEIAIWSLRDGVGVIPYIISLKSLEIGYLELVCEGNIWKAKGSLDVLFGKIVLVRCPQNYDDEVGLVEVENVDVFVPRY